MSQIIVQSCYMECPFYESDSFGMHCTHPFFEDKGLEDMIITHNNSKDGNIPDECPLRNINVKIVKDIKLKELCPNLTKRQVNKLYRNGQPK